MTTRRSVLGCRETSGPPELLHGALFSVRVQLLERSARIWEHTRCGCTQFDWVAEVGRTHRVSFSLGGRKICRRKGALAGKKSVAPPDAGRGWTDGERVRVRLVPKQVLLLTAHEFRLGGSRHDERRSRALARLALTGESKR
jgi:hypothetical protein